ncbi:MAG: hypothetical protein K8Q88_00005 [Nitrosarchaeum sp.]|nr:hypothetical protein [Nitrosarchaeum sp.]
MSVDYSLSSSSTWIQWLKEQAFDQTLSIKITTNGKEVCTLNGRDHYEVNIPEFTELLEKALMTSGFIELFFSYSDPFKPTSKINSANMEADMQKWFTNILTKRFLAIDTNIIIDRTLSVLDLINPNKILNVLPIRIPRLSILELERKTNDTKNDIEKRLMFQGYSELLHLKDKGATTLQDLDIETLTGFTKISGSGRTDSWIRREISNAKKIPKLTLTEKLTGVSIAKFDEYVFITTDLVNSLSAIAEGIPTIYVSRMTDWQNKLRKGNLQQVARFLITLAVLHESINVEVNSKKFELVGMWHGKTVWDYGVEHARYRFLN